MLRAAQEQAENSVASARAEAEKTRNAARTEAERSVTEAHKQAETAVSSAKAQAKQVLDEATARATAIHDGAERRLNLLMSRHTEAIRRLTEIRDVVTTLVAGEVSRGSLEDEVEKAVANSIAESKAAAGGRRRPRRGQAGSAKAPFPRQPAPRRRLRAWRRSRRRPAAASTSDGRSPPRPSRRAGPDRRASPDRHASPDRQRAAQTATPARRPRQPRPRRRPSRAEGASNGQPAEARRARPGRRPPRAGNGQRAEGDAPRPSRDRPMVRATRHGRVTACRLRGVTGGRGGEGVETSQDDAFPQRPGADLEFRQAEQVHGRVGHDRARGELRGPARGTPRAAGSGRRRRSATAAPRARRRRGDAAPAGRRGRRWTGPHRRSWPAAGTSSTWPRRGPAGRHA